MPAEAACGYASLNVVVVVKDSVIYTSVVGRYDLLMQPAVTDSDFDYVCFVGKGEKHSDRIGVWQIREVPYESRDPRIVSRFPKINPHLVFPDCRYSVWLDGNVAITGGYAYSVFKEKIRSGALYSGMKHWQRDCAYDEAYACINARKDNFFDIVRTLKFLKDENFPRHFGLYENNVIFRRHNDPAVMNFDSMWWECYLGHVHRDQILHPYCMRKCGMGFDYLLPEPYCARNHDAFLYRDHIGRRSLFPRLVATQISRIVSRFI